MASTVSAQNTESVKEIEAQTSSRRRSCRSCWSHTDSSTGCCSVALQHRRRCATHGRP